jgi:VCBS repeat-containing protein
VGKAPTISAGPAPGNDFFSVTEDQATAVGGLIFDVLANDAKKAALYSLDNATVADLLQEDTPGIAELSALGNSVRITSDGKVNYATGLNNSLIQGLAAGETLTDSFLYAFRQGTNLVWQTVHVTITGLNDAPVARVDTGLAFEDSITTGSVALNDSDVDHNAVLHFAATGNVPAGFAMASDGSWSFDASDPSYQALRANESHDLAVAYTVTDERGARSSSILIVTLTGTNDAPQVSAAVTGSAIEDAASVPLAALAQASDVDHGASLSVVGVPQQLPAGVTYDAASSSFTLDPTDAAYQQLADGETTVVTVTYGVSDGAATTPASVSWTVTGTNDAPVATSPAAEVGEGATVSGQLTALDPDHGAALSFAVAGDAPAGFSLAPDGSWAFDASGSAYDSLAAGEIRIVEVPFAVTDDHGATAGSQLIIAVTGTNDAPVATAGVAEASEGASISGTLAALASDVDNNAALNFSAGELPPGFSLSADGQWTFDAAHPAYDGLGAGQSMDVVVGYHVADGEGGGADSTLTITVTGTNDAPVAIGQAVSATIALYPATTTLAGQVSATDADAGAHLTYAIQGFVPDGFVMNADGSWNWTLPLQEGIELNEGQVSAGQLSFVATDEHGASSTGVLQISLIGSNDAPVRDDAFASATEDQVISGTYHGVDPDLGAVLTYQLDPGSDPGFTVASNGSWQFDAGNPAYQSLAAGQTRQVVAGIHVTDEHGASVLSPLFVTITGTNDGPVLTGAPATLPNGTEDVGLIVTPQQLLQGWSDPDGGTVQVTSLTADNATIAQRPDGSWSVFPKFDYNGPLTLSYQVSDGSASTAASLSLNLAPVNDAPRFETAFSLTAIPAQVEDTPFTLSQQQLLTGWSDAEHSALTVTNVTFSNGSTVKNADGSFTFQPSADYFGSTSAFVTVSDGALTRTQQEFFTIAGVADPAHISGVSNGTVIENQYFNNVAVATATGNLNSIEPDNSADNDKWQAISAATSSDHNYGSFTVTAAGVWTYSLDNGNPAVNALATGQSLTDSFTVHTLDGTSQLVTMVINGRTDFQYIAPDISGADPNDFDTLHSEGTQPTFVNISGTAGNDVYDGSDTIDSIEGWGGADLIYGHGGNDVLRGAAAFGRPNYAEVSADTLYGQAGTDQLEGGLGADRLYGGSGNDTLYGESGTAGTTDAGDFLYGGSGNDTIYGHYGDDVIVGGYGSDILTGGGGNDAFIYLSVKDSGDAIIDYTALFDTLDLSAIDANTNLAGDQAFGWAAGTPAANSAWMVQDGAHMLLFADTDGDPTTAEFMIQFVNLGSQSVTDPWSGFIM